MSSMNTVRLIVATIGLLALATNLVLLVQAIRWRHLGGVAHIAGAFAAAVLWALATLSYYRLEAFWHDLPVQARDFTTWPIPVMFLAAGWVGMRVLARAAGTELAARQLRKVSDDGTERRRVAAA